MSYASYIAPPPPPTLSPELQHQLLRFAFDYAVATFNLVDERHFYADMLVNPNDQTQHYSPFLLNILLGIGCRYLDPLSNFPRELCSVLDDPSTRGEPFITYARSSIEREWNFRAFSRRERFASSQGADHRSIRSQAVNPSRAGVSESRPKWKRG